MMVPPLDFTVLRLLDPYRPVDLESLSTQLGIDLTPLMAVIQRLEHARLAIHSTGGGDAWIRSFAGDEALTVSVAPEPPRADAPETDRPSVLHPSDFENGGV
jgi:hypothetical protein